MKASLDIDCVELFARSYGDLAQRVQSFCEQKATAGLEHAFAAGLAVNRATGFVKDDLREARRYLLLSPDPQTPAFLAQHNSRRKDRFAGAGRQVPPEGIRPEHSNCPICNAWWQQCGTELGYRYALADVQFIAYPNPFPFGDSHFTHASAIHRPQSWIGDNRNASLLSLRRNIACTVAHATATPERVVFINDESAGASLPGHFHLQSLLRRDGHGYWPLELAASHARRGSDKANSLLILNYPLPVVHWCGTWEDVVADSSEWIKQWLDASGSGNTLRVHIIATTRIGKSECVQLFIAPRDSQFPYSALMNGAVGSLEVLGEFVFCTESEREMLMSGRINHATASQILASVEPVGQREILKALCKSEALDHAGSLAATAAAGSSVCQPRHALAT